MVTPRPEQMIDFAKQSPRCIAALLTVERNSGAVGAAAQTDGTV